MQFEESQCFQHDENVPVETITAISCKAHYVIFDRLDESNICDFDLFSNEYAWIDEETQHLKADETDYKKLVKDKSALFKKKTKAYCRNKSTTVQLLNPGRSCQDSS